MKKIKLFTSLIFLIIFTSSIQAQFTDLDLQAAIDAASPGSTINLNAGTYTLNAVVNVNKTGITLLGNTTIFEVSGTGDRLDISADGVTLENVEIIKTDKTGPQEIIRLRANNITIKNNIIHGQFVIGDGEVSRAMVFNAGAYSGLQIEGNTIYDLRQPAYISGTNTGNIINNNTYNTKGWVVEGGNLTFTNNTWGINVYDIAIIPSCPAIYYTDIAAMSNTNNGAVIEDQRVSPAVLSVVHVDGSTSFTTDLGGDYHPYSSITPAITRVVNGGKILVAAGTYTEQLTVDNKSVSIIGAGKSTTFLNAPAVMAITFTTSNPHYCIVGALGNSVLNIDGFTIDGLSNGNSRYRYVGIGYRNAGGSVVNCDINNIQDSPFSGAQHGVAVYMYNNDGIPRSFDLTGCTLRDFQKNATAINSDDALTVNISGNTVNGKGATGVTAQNGIQIFGDNITGNIDNNIVNGIEWIYPGTGTAWVATSILNFYGDVDIFENTVNNGQVGLYNIDGSSNIDDNDFNIVNSGSYAYGIVATDPPSAIPYPFNEEDGSMPIRKVKNPLEATVTVNLRDNTVSFGGTDNLNTCGIEADAGYGPDDITLLATNNTVSGFGVGIGVYQCESGCDVGVFTSLNFNHNNILNNTLGFETNLIAPVNAENNWWGTAVESEIQALISGPVDYDPWIGKTKTLNCTNSNLNYNFLNGVIINFNTLPAGGGNVTVIRENNIPTSPPNGVTNLELWIDLTSSMPNFSFNATVIADVFGIPDFNASTTVMYYNSTTSSWLAVSGGTYLTSDPLFGGHPSFSFTTNHFTPFTFINTPSTAYNVYLSSSTSAATGFVYPNTDWGITGYEPDDWDFTAPISLYIVPEAGSVFGASDMTIQWDNTLFNFVGVDKTGGIYDGANFQFLYNQLGNTDQVTINASALTNSNFNTVGGDYIAKLDLNLLKPGFGPVSFTALDFRAFDGAGGQLGVYVTGNNAQVKSYLGDVASPGPDASTGDGLVNFEDLSLWSSSYWSGVPGYVNGTTYYKVKYDVGPTTTNTVYGMPTTDGKIQFEDLVIFSMSYGLSANHVYPKLNAEPTEPVELKLGNPIFSGIQTRIPLFVSGGVQNVRAMNLTFAGNFGKLVGVEKGELLTSISNPVMVMKNVEGNQVFVDFALFGANEFGISSSGEVLTLVFEGNADININSANVRNILNGTMKVNFPGSVETIPDEFALLQNYPNPFNPSTTISYNLPKQAMVEISVFNALGERVATLVNELKEAGRYNVELNALGYSSGIYFYQIKANDFVSVKKMILMK